ncbi:MAG: hypothetical protein DRP82_05590 [Planctomycetota bacterium]|nr:MAG: hypothetical protein DRP82_05590 [Planctomycetota bacterium]
MEKMEQNLPLHLMNRKNEIQKAEKEYLPILVEELERDLQEHPNYADIHNRLGLVRHFVGDFGAARAAFLRALTINKNYVDCICNMAYTILEAEGPASAISWSGTHMNRLSNWRITHTHARILAQAGLWREAADALDSIPSPRLAVKVDAVLCRLVADPADTRALATLEKILGESKTYRQLLKRYKLTSPPLDSKNVARILRYNPNIHLVYVDMAKVAANRNDMDAARLLFSAATRICPNSPFAEHALGNIFMSRGQRSRAKKHFLRAIEFDPFFVNAHLNLAYICVSQGKDEEALKWFQEAVKAAPSFPDVRYQLANHLIQMGRYDEAIPHLKKALSLNPNYAFARFALATALFHLGRYAECLRIYKDIKPGSIDMVEIHAQKAACLLLLGDPVSAITECAYLLPGDEERATLLFYLAQTLKKMGDNRRATKLLRLVSSRFPHTRAAFKSKRILRKKD